MQVEDRLVTWKTHFKRLVSSDNPSTSNHPDDPNIDNDTFSRAEIDVVTKQMQLRKAPGLHGISH